MTEPMPMPPPAKADEPATRPVKSKGEKVFDRAVYAGIAGVGTFIVSVVLADSLKVGSLKFMHQGATEWITKAAKWITPNRSAEKIADMADKAALTTSLMTGGNLMLLPIGLAEKHKVQIVDGLNAAMDDKTQKEAIQQAPKQTWKSLLESRAVAWLAVYTTFKVIGKHFEETMTSFERQTGELLCRIMKKPEYKAPEEVVATIKSDIKDFAYRENKDALRAAKAKLQGFETRTYRYGKLGALDVFATIGAASLLYLGGHFFARKQEEKIEKRAEHKIIGGSSALREDAIDEPIPHKEEVPNVQIAGSKMHDGMAREAALSQQL